MPAGLTARDGNAGGRERPTTTCCVSCGFENAGGIKFCGQCGSRLTLRCLGCGFTNEPGIRFCGECGKTLVAATGDARDLRSYTPAHLAEKILQSRSALEGERKLVTVLFADVKGSMDLAAELDPEEWHGILDRFFRILTDGVHRFEGTVNQYTGDGIMALFGAPIAHEDHAQRACYAALHLREELRRYAEELKRTRGVGFAVRMGLNSGEVVVGRIGDDLRMDYTAQGHTVGLAQRMEGLADPGTVYVSEATAELVGALFDLRDLGRFEIKGAQQALGVRELRGTGKLRTRFDLSRARGLSRFVGRGEEMKTLEAAIDRALRGQGQVVGVVAEAGTGKSRLCFELAELCRSRGISVREAHCVAHGKMVPFVPVLELMRGYFGIDSNDGDETARDKIAGRMVRLDPELSDALPLVFDFLGVPDAARPSPAMGARERERQIYAIVRRLVHARSERQAAVTLFEDLHWIDGPSDAFLRNLVESIPGTRTLLVVNFRPEYRADWMRASHYQQIALLPLGAEAIAELLGSLLGADPSLAGLADLIAERAGGNPFFIEEWVRSLVETGSLVGPRGAYRLVTPVSDLSVPATVQAVLAARIDRLGEREKDVLQRASVIGKTFSESILARLVELSAEELSEALGRLVTAEFLYEESLFPEVEYSFRHPLTQEVAYGSQLGERRKATHAAVARALEEIHRGRLDENAAVIAWHREGSGETFEAATWHRRAAVWLGINNYVESLPHWRRAYELSRTSAESPQARELLAEASGQILLSAVRVGGDHQEIDRLFAEARELTDETADFRSRAVLRIHYGYLKGLSGKSPESDGALEEAESLAEASRDREALAAARYAMASFSVLLRGNAGRPEEIFERAFRLAEEGPEVSPVIGVNLPGVLHTIRSLGRGVAGNLEAAKADLERAAAIGRSGHPAITLLHNYSFALLRDLPGDPAAALARGRQAAEIGERIGALQGMARYALGEAELLNGNADEAHAIFVETLEGAQDRGIYGFQEPMLLGAIARASLERGDLESALRSAREAAVIAANRGFIGADAHLALARVLMKRGDFAEVDQALAAAERLAESSGARTRQAYVREARAELARLRGDNATRREELCKAAALWRDMRIEHHAGRVAKELDG